MISDISRASTIAFAVVIAAGRPAIAEAQGARPTARTGCAPRAAANGPVFIVGNEGGNLKPRATKLWADGSVQAMPGSRTAADADVADSIATLARFARESSFWNMTAPRITKPTRNPDMSREFLEVHLRCGVKHSLYPADAEPAPFHELFARLTNIAARAAAR